MNPISAPSLYVFPERALRRWAKENLVLSERADAVDARFRFEGSTCGNVELHLDYHVTLQPEGDAWRLGPMYCAPSPGDEGHQQMCCWRADEEGVVRAMKEEAPLQGELLEAVTTWRPRRSPAGCLCGQSDRLYKWQAVLETLHFALRRPPAETPTVS
jgi:hypothetical protein